MLKLIDIKKDYITGDQVVHALKGINLEFRKNEFVAILGHSGCGKTTLLNIIGGLDKYSFGDLIINNLSTKNYKDADWDAYRNNSIGFVFQSYNLIMHLTVLENVELALTLSGVDSKTRKEKAISVLNQVGLHDQINKKPNQLSGGQMQRVAIARALVNDPEIILADEPTGALDSETSTQIMELLKDISNDRLIIMVTHNREIAEKYASRIIKLKDGLIVGDNHPYDKEKIVSEDNNNSNKKVTTKTSMSFFTALSLSFKNLFTKKARTLLTSFAGSIGIVGIALVLSLANGFQSYINKLQSDTLSTYPLTISESAFDVSSMMNIMQSQINQEQFPDDKNVNGYSMMNSIANSAVTNNISPEFVQYIKDNIDNEELVNDIKYVTKTNFNVYTPASYTVNGEIFNGYFNVPTNLTISSAMSLSIWEELIDNEEFINSQYDVLEGHLPTNKNEIVIVVDKYNRLSIEVLKLLGFSDEELKIETGKDSVKISFDDILNKQFSLVPNDSLYRYNEETNTFTKQFFQMSQENTTINCFTDPKIYESGLELKISGIIRINEQTNIGSISGSICYHPDLTKYIIENSTNSQIVQWMLNEDNVNKDPFSGITTDEETYNQTLEKLGYSDSVSQIIFYPLGFKQKEEIKNLINEYNNNQSEENKITIVDQTEIVVNTLNTMVDAISYVLIAFTAISLVVSSIMIGIITYISVLERTKEIGVLRSIGARKKDISRVFNAETIIIGFIAGLLGVVFTLILNIPINLILNSLLSGINNLASLNIFHGLILIVVSILLTLIAGLIPSNVAAKKDPVLALRNE